MDMAACGIIQLARTCAMKRASHGPNSTPLRVELDGFAEVLILAAAEVAEILLLRVPAHVADRVGDDADGGTAGSVGRVESGGRSGAAGASESSGGLPLSPSFGCAGSGTDGFGGAFGGVASRRSGELPRAKGIGFVGLSARSHGLRPAILVRQVRSRRHSGRRHIELRLDEDKPRPLAFALALPLEFGAHLLFDRLLPLLHHFAHPRQARPEQDRDQHERVDVDGNQHDFPPRQWLRDPRRVGTIVVEVEVHQGLNEYSSSVVGSWLAVRGSRFAVRRSSNDRVQLNR